MYRVTFTATHDLQKHFKLSRKTFVNSTGTMRILLKLQTESTIFNKTSCYAWEDKANIIMTEYISYCISLVVLPTYTITILSHGKVAKYSHPASSCKYLHTFARRFWTITLQLFVVWCFKISCLSPRHHIISMLKPSIGCFSKMLMI